METNLGIVRNEQEAWRIASEENGIKIGV